MLHPKLDPKRIIKTIGLLKIRIEERFPGGGLGRVCGDLKEIAQDTDQKIEEIQRNHFGYRFVLFLVVTGTLFLAIFGLSRLKADQGETTLTEMLQVLEALFNLVVLTGAAIIFLVSIENRTKRRKVIKAVNALRCLAHVIDSHQLTKDPCYVDKKVIRTSHSPERNMDGFLLNRYLDYCTEMLSLVSKVAFLYVQDYHDSVSTKAVKDLEDLTTGLSQKIWQKIMNIKKEDVRILK